MGEVAAPALALDRISVSFVSEGAARYTAVSETTLTVQPGEFVSVVGPAGCGKSTLLNIAAGLLLPSAGDVRVNGEPLRGLNAKAGYLFQSEALLPWRTALDNVIVGLEFRGVPRGEAVARGEKWLARVGLRGHGHRYPHQLSGGMRKRVALAQTLILDPQIILMDEPFSALDIQTRQLMENELLELWSADMRECVQRIEPGFNRCVIFPVSRTTYHGVVPVRCPSGRSRKSIALYYFRDEGRSCRLRPTRYVARPGDSPLTRVAIRLDRWAVAAYSALKRYTPLNDALVARILRRF